MFACRATLDSGRAVFLRRMQANVTCGDLGPADIVRALAGGPLASSIRTLTPFTEP